MTEIVIAQLPRRLRAKEKFLKWITGNCYANKKEEFNEEEKWMASWSRKKITNNNKSSLRKLTDLLDHHNCSPNRFAKTKLFSRFFQQTRNAVGFASTNANKFKNVVEIFATNNKLSSPNRTTYSKNNTGHTSILSIITNTSKFHPHS